MHARQSEPNGLKGRSITGAAIRAGLAGAVTTELFGLAARAVGVPMKARSVVDRSPKPVFVGGFALTVVPAVVLGAVLAAIVRRWTPRPASTFVGITIVLTAVSLVAPLGARDTATATRVMLATSHLLAAAIAIPLLAGTLPSRRRPRAQG